MTKKEVNKAITRLTKTLRELAKSNPELLESASIYLHHFDENNLPLILVGAEKETHNTHRTYSTYEVIDAEGVFKITCFT